MRGHLSRLTKQQLEQALGQWLVEAAHHKGHQVRSHRRGWGLGALVTSPDGSLFASHWAADSPEALLAIARHHIEGSG